MISKSRDAWVTVSRFLVRCRDTERAILPGIRCPVCLLISVFRRIPGIPVVKIVPGIDLYSDNYTKKKKPGFRKFRSDSGFQTGIHPESTRNRWGSVKTSNLEPAKMPNLEPNFGPVWQSSGSNCGNPNHVKPYALSKLLYIAKIMEPTWREVM